MIKKMNVNQALTPFSLHALHLHSVQGEESL